MKKIIIILVLAVAAFAGWYVWNWVNRPVSSMAGMKSDFTLDADSFLVSFVENEEASNSRYGGKIIEVTGIVQAVNPDIPSIMLETADPLFGIDCVMEKGSELNLSDVTPGSQITIRGECGGYIGDVQMNRCIIIQ